MLVMVACPAYAADLGVAAKFFSDSAPVSVERTEGNPPAAIVRAADGRVLGYAFSSLDVSGSVGYSGRPLDIVAAVTPDGHVAGAEIVAHEEPILVIGISQEKLAAYVAGFRGFDVRPGATLKPTLKPTNDIARGQDAIAGATNTSTVIRLAIIRSARAVLRSQTAARDGAVRLDRETLRRASWPSLLAEGSVQQRLVLRGEAAKLLGTQDSEPNKVFINLWLALATPPSIGESLLGQQIYESELSKIGAEDDLILIGASGLYSFRGTEWRQSGSFSRIELVQDSRAFHLNPSDYTPIETLHAAGAPELREIAIFRIPKSRGFDATKPFRLDLDLGGGALGSPAVVSLDYRIPQRYLITSTKTPAAAPPAKITPSAAPASMDSLWPEYWEAKRYEIIALGAMLTILSAILIFQDTVTAHGTFYYWLRIGFLLSTVGFLGFYAGAQLSVVNVLTFINALLSGFRWELFLIQPLVFILWSFVAVSMLFWGRGVFCGWLCPFGALQELTNQLARRISDMVRWLSRGIVRPPNIKQIEIPFRLHERLWMIKYVAFLAILAISLYSAITAYELAEIEPFKTVIVLKFMRDWPFGVYAALLLLAGLFVERFYCRYLCPLGAALAIPARMRMFEWLKRYRECGAECHVCARRCTVQAIHPLGQINPNECIYCLKCQANYFDQETCLHLKKRAQRRQPAASPGKAAPPS